MTNEEKKSRKLKISIIVSIALSLSIIGLILYFTLDAATFEYLATVPIHYEFFALAIVCAMLYWVFWGARLNVLSKALNPQVRVSWWEGTKIVIANQFLASITPSMAGGEPVRIYLLNKDGLSVGEATATVLGERLIDAIFLLVCIPFAFFIIKDYLSSYPVVFSLFNMRVEIDLVLLALFAGVVFFIILIFLFLYAIKNPEKTKRFISGISKRLSRFSKKKKGENLLVDRINHEVDNFHNSMVYFLTGGRKAFLIATLLTVLYWSIGFLIPSLILLGLGLPPFFLQSYAAQIFLVVIVMLPLTPGSTGVSELSIAGLYSLMIGSSLISVFVILFRLITYHFNLIAGAIFQYRIFKSLTSFSLDIIEKKDQVDAHK